MDILKILRIKVNKLVLEDLLKINNEKILLMKMFQNYGVNIRDIDIM